jgi:eukaryotic-like serine/threonine-protein kinase
MPNIRYQALGPLLSGEGSRAFLGLAIVDEHHVGPVVLVWVPEEKTQDAEQISLIAKETARAALLEHPNIIRVSGLAALEEGVARVVEFADGEGLRRILDVVGQLPSRLATRLVVDAAMGVHYAHVAGNDDGTPLVHGDIRPETLLVTHAGVTKVSGYGALSVAPKEMGGSRVRGRRMHCAPEQILGGRDTMSRATDVYLLGVVLYECLTGKVPFEGEPDFDQAVLRQPVPDLPDSVPSKLNEILRKAMSKRAAERYPTAQAFREAVLLTVDDVGTSEDLAVYLAENFPEMAQNQLARHHVIDAAIAEIARNNWQRSGGVGAPPVIPSTLPKVTAPKPPPPVSPPPSLSPPPSNPVESSILDDAIAPDVPHQSKARLAALGMGALLVVLVVAKLATSGERHTMKAALPSERPAAETAATAQAAEAAPPPAPVAESPPAPLPKPAEPPMVQITSDPPLDVLEAGTRLGRTPLTVALPAGPHTLQLVDASLGIRITRKLTVRPTGKTSQHVSVGKGTVAITAPDGANIFINGVRKGQAPLEELELYEGSHRILVTVGGAKWQQPFTLRDGERMYFNVEEE